MIPGTMSKISNIFRPRNNFFQGPLGEEIKNSFRFLSNSGISTASRISAPDGKSSHRVFAAYSIFKGKAALTASPVLPSFSKLDSGDLKMDRRGVIMLTFLPAIGERKYAYEKRQVFALSATEVGSFISLGPNGSCEFFHDPGMLSSNSGQVRKSLSIKAHEGGGGYYISLNVVNNTLKTNDRLTVPITTAEYAVMREAFSFALPHIMGWDRFTNCRSNDASEGTRRPTGSEWDR